MVVLAALLLCASPLLASGWSVARSAHFDVYAQAGEENARSVLLGFERLHAFFLRQTGQQMDTRPPVRVIVFASPQEYEPYRIGPASDAYYAGTESRDYIVMARRGPGDWRVAAHEYWHFIEHATSQRLPPWLNEGLAEFFSGVRLDERASQVARELDARTRTLRTRPWMPLSELLALPADAVTEGGRAASDLFYAQSWALADMLMLAPEYGPHFRELVAALAAGARGTQAFQTVYGKRLDSVAGDLRAWVGKRKVTPFDVPSVSSGALAIEASDLSPLAARSLIAGLWLATSRFDRAEGLYRELASQAPANPDFSAALATIALHKGHYTEARRDWAGALAEGIRDPEVCYRYAIAAQIAGLPADDVRPALERAVALRPTFDDALYVLALIENNAGEYAAGLRHLRAMHTTTPGRQFPYWIATADALTGLGNRAEAKAAADTAASKAATPEQRAYAVRLGVIALTDLAVQFTRDAAGDLRLVTTRAPHDAPEWNPFVEPGDRIHRVEGKLREIDCSGPATLFSVETAAGLVTVSVPDPLHVQMRNAPPEFTCGPQPLAPVAAVYAASTDAGVSGVLRGLEFR